MNQQVKRWVAMVVLILVLWWGAVTTFQSALAADSLYVTPGGDDNQDCLSPLDACATIDGALAKSGDVINVATGVYTDTGAEVVFIDRNVTLLGGWDEAFTAQNGLSIIDAEGARRGVHVIYGVSVVIERFIIRNGWTFDISGRAGGSGILNFGQLTINNSSINDNSIWTRGAIYNFNILTLNQSSVNDNSAEGTSGIFNEGFLILNNSTVSGNRSRDSGGAIYLDGGSLRLNNSTVTDNIALFSSAGISQSASNYSYVRMQNSIVAGNKSYLTPNCSGTVNSGGYNLIGDTDGCDFVTSDGDQFVDDAQLDPLTDMPGYHPIRFGSPAMDAGNPAGCTDWLGNLFNTDQRGVFRLRRCDIGAYEYDGPYLETFLPFILQYP